MKNILLSVILSASALLCNSSSEAQWQFTDFPAGKAIQCLVVNGNSVYVGTTTGLYLSSNNGATWNATSLNYSVLSVAINGDSIFAGTYQGLYLSTNNCVSWTPITNGLTDLNIFSLMFKGDSLLAATLDNGKHGHMFISTDGGLTWAFNYNFEASFDMGIYILAIRGSSIYIATDWTIFSSSNDGQTWDSWHGNDIDRAMCFVGDNVFIGIRSGTFAGGVMKNYDFENPCLAIVDYCLIEYSGNLFTGGKNVGAFVSVDTGTTWSPINDGFTDSTIYFLANNSSTLFAVDSKNVLWRRSLSDIVTSVKDNESSSSFSLYPNPSADKLNFSVSSLPPDRPATLSILTPLGQTVYKSEIHNPKSEIDISSLSKGIYLLQLTGAEGRSVRRFVKE